MEDNGKGTQKENIHIVNGGLGGGQGPGPGPGPTGAWFLIDNPDPAHLIQRVYLHGDEVQVIDNIPIEKARSLFEEELEKTVQPKIVGIKEKIKENIEYEPSTEEVEIIKDWAKNPQVFLDEGQLQKVYDFGQGSIWDFFLHALKIKKIPTPKERIEKGFDSYLKTYNFTDAQIHILQDIKDIFAENIAHRNRITPQDIFDNPVYVRLIGADYQEVNQKFDNRLPQVFNELQSTFRV
ncbi:MAG: type I restriction-modification enzyme R subunit C-terminal domain-containing protein [Nanoarchaeota archaeon]